MKETITNDDFMMTKSERIRRKSPSEWNCHEEELFREDEHDNDRGHEHDIIQRNAIPQTSFNRWTEYSHYEYVSLSFLEL